MHVLNSEHAQSVLCLLGDAHWMDWLGITIILNVHMVLGRAYFKPRGVKKNSVPYIVKIVYNNVPI